MPPAEKDVVCPKCNTEFQDWYRYVGVNRDGFDEKYLDECVSAICPTCKYKIYYDSLDNKTEGFKKTNARINRVIGELGTAERERILRTINKDKAKLYAKLQAATMLGKSVDSPALKVQLSDDIPLAIQPILDDLSDTMLWLLCHRQKLKEIQLSLDIVIDNYELITTGDSFTPSPEKIHRRSINETSLFFEDLNVFCAEKVDKIIDKLINMYGNDGLGAYNYTSNSIIVYWIPIWLCASRLNISFENLTIIFLINAMAYRNMHIGGDASGDRWDTDSMRGCDRSVRDGLAQYYTETLCIDLKSRDFLKIESDHAKLLDQLPKDFLVYKNWIPNHRKRAEIIRQSLIEFRGNKMRTRQEFESLINKNNENFLG